MWYTRERARAAAHVALLAIAATAVPLLTIEHETLGMGHTLRLDCYLTRATSNYASASSCAVLIDTINHDQTHPYLIVGERAAVIADEVVALAVATAALDAAGAFVVPVVGLARPGCATAARAASWARVFTSVAVVTGGFALDAAQRWGREHDAAAPAESETYASLGAGAYVIAGLPLVSILADAQA